MKINKVEIFNYKSIGHKCIIECDKKSTTLVGRSNVGKSNLLDAISFAFKNDPLDAKDLCSWNKDEPICHHQSGTGPNTPDKMRPGH